MNRPQEAAETPSFLTRYGLGICRAIVAVSFIYYIAMMRPGYGWGGDAALYLMHAKNIAYLRPFADIAFLVHPGATGQTPSAYPPMWPLLLAPVVRLRGLDYFSFRALDSALLLLSLVPVFVLTRRRLGVVPAVLLVALLPFSAVYLPLKDQMTPAGPYMLFSCLALMFLSADYETDAFRSNAARGIRVGLLCAAACLTSTAGAFLIPAMVLYELIRHRRIHLYTVAAIVSFGAAYFLGHHYAPFDGAGGGHFSQSLSVAVRDAVSFAGRLSYLGGNAYSNSLRYLTAVILFLAALAGLLRSIMRGGNPEDWYGLLLIFGFAFRHSAGADSVLPLAPVLLIWAFGGISMIHERKWLPAPVLAAPLLLMVLCEVLFLSTQTRAPFTEGVNKPDFLATVEYLNRSVPRDSVLVSWNPRVFGLYSGIRSAAPPTDSNEWDSLVPYYREIGATHEILYQNNAADKVRAHIVLSHPDVFRLVYANDDFSVYRIDWGTPRPEFPRPQFRREQWLTLNGQWNFRLADDAPLRRIVVPFAPESRLSGVADESPHTHVRYEREFSLPANWSGGRTLLHFGAVNYETEVRVNGVRAGGHTGGYTPFVFDITSLLRPGSNKVEVDVRNYPYDRYIARGKQTVREANYMIFYQRVTGIWQSVWLEHTGDAWLSSVLADPAEDGWVTFHAKLVNPFPGAVLHALISHNGVTVAGGETEFSGERAQLRVHVLKPELWSPEHPELYETVFEVTSDGRPVDRVESYFGFRTIATQDGRVFLNGSQRRFRMVLDQGYWKDSLMTPPDDASIVNDIRVAKEMGFDGVRKHQKLEDPRYLYWADRMGIAVSGEMANAFFWDPGAAAQFTREWLDAVTRDYNSPSIVQWIPVNENWGVPRLAVDPVQQQYVRGLYHLTRSEGGNRLVIDNDGWLHSSDTDLFSVHDYRAADKLSEVWAGLTLPATRVPDTFDTRTLLPGQTYNGSPVIVDEFGGIALVAEKDAATTEGYFGVETDRMRAEQRISDVYKVFASVPAVQGFCYTQLYDIAQERNGLLTWERKPKFDPAFIRRLNQSLN